MPTIYLLNKPDVPDNEKYLAIKYIKNEISNDAYLLGVFIQIVAEMKLFDLANGKIKELKWDEKIGYHYTLYAKDRLGQNRNRIVIKKLFGEKFSYEIRVDEEHIKHRILFFCSSEKETEFFVLSFGFEKQKTSTIDLTDSLSKSTSNIKKSIDADPHNEEVLNYWLGGERIVI